jgi:hypothetical protein
VATQQQASSGGVGFLGLLTVLFIGLKLHGDIDWSWAWVTVPLWGPFILVFLVILTVAIVAASGRKGAPPRLARVSW